MSMFGPIHSRIVRHTEIQEGWYVVKQDDGQPHVVVSKLFLKFADAEAEAFRLNDSPDPEYNL